ncbi:hypothetical protein AMAG_02865 [Allomyces macrogynus ATCC 38327]|uniref:Uncharacterized protein n=1 Tax=Allomyces macrogynus (strain ATCC 38327) TaxID=578462 RepID=A0A0L0S3Y1_ALLM3|nr:hypothetical protein AMAG_02865 [Allomyces macrogynus ATCC 38327]|eukprot:KNE57115.1 hypothetical protein AMAG_02865 [Allomyces macrogynus ATCC 38327]
MTTQYYYQALPVDDEATRAWLLDDRSRLNRTPVQPETDMAVCTMSTVYEPAPAEATNAVLEHSAPAPSDVLVCTPDDHPTPPSKDAAPAPTSSTDDSALTWPSDATPTQVRDRLNQLVMQATMFRAQIDADRTQLAAVAARLRELGALSPDEERAASAGVHALMQDANPDSSMAVTNLAKQFLTGSATLAAAGATGTVVGMVAAARASTFIATKLLARGMIGPAALAALAGVGAFPAAVGVGLGAAMGAGVWYGVSSWQQAHEMRTLIPILRQTRRARDELILAQIAVHGVLHELSGRLDPRGTRPERCRLYAPGPGQPAPAGPRLAAARQDSRTRSVGVDRL